ncbi:5'-3' deoxyribonucleotidase [Invertebrate iridescent virus 30]|uniref:DNA repair exonuclease SbcCD D subunit n=1 Tax=Invertebrate iridescent virus 30 TaxID=345585 RepID=W8W2V8_9VIRU|nr:5'-3' deoxyribonucleotidase [Invertebrate iridescent virus 30]CCV02214.1 DNA repair exonuclease SbcCD D subunit [Invertebrate iridescent virus 30]
MIYLYLKKYKINMDLSNIKIFIDLDGVLADFEQGVLTQTGQTIELLGDKMWNKLSQTPNFFNSLKWCSEGIKLWNFVKQFNPIVLTGLPLGNWAEPQKRDWCSHNLGKDIDVICCKSKDKFIKAKEYLKFDSNYTMILIDDRINHQLEWTNNKGIFIHHTNNADTTIESLKKVMFSINVLFIGDPHFKIKNVEFIPLFISKILKVINDFKLDFVVVAGDLLDNHDKVDVEPLNLATQFINLLRKKIKTFILVGNHDYKNNQQFLTDHHWMNSLKYWDNVVIVDNITTFTMKNFEFLFVPYVPPGKFIEALKTKINFENEIKKYKAIFAHQEFYGCKMGPIKSKEGDKWNTDWPIVISGHIHNKQWCQKNIYYPGSAMQHAFGQSIENTVSILNFNNEELSYEEIDLKMPKLTIKYMSVNDVIHRSLDKYKNKINRKYKIVLQGTAEEFQTFKKSLKYKELLNDGFKITFKVKSSIMVPEDHPIKKNFIDILNNKIKEEKDPELESIFQQFILN